MILAWILKGRKCVAFSVLKLIMDEINHSIDETWMYYINYELVFLVKASWYNAIPIKLSKTIKEAVNTFIKISISIGCDLCFG